jgi:uncharacterized DUF497 family protein
MNYNFEWNILKAISNKQKHNVSFESAATVFLDANALTIYDVNHSDFEDRWITMGIAGNNAILVVVHTFKDVTDDSAIIRIISARKATKNEILQYQGKI